MRQQGSKNALQQIRVRFRHNISAAVYFSMNAMRSADRACAATMTEAQTLVVLSSAPESHDTVKLWRPSKLHNRDNGESRRTSNPYPLFLENFKTREVPRRRDFLWEQNVGS